jgi:hypothetical protein
MKEIALVVEKEALVSTMEFHESTNIFGKALGSLGLKDKAIVDKRTYSRREA